MSGLILIVEDDNKTLKLLRDTLEVCGYIVIEATNGKEAIDRAIREKPDLITMDLQLPVISGLDVTRTLKANPVTQNIPVIAITASAMKGKEQEALNAGCDAYICKPFDIDMLVEKVKGYLPQNESMAG